MLRCHVGLALLQATMGVLKHDGLEITNVVETSRGRPRQWLYSTIMLLR